MYLCRLSLAALYEQLGGSCLEVELMGASLVAQMVKNPSANAGDLDSIPGSGRSPGEGNGYPLQYSCLENPMDLGARWAAVHGVAKSRTRLNNFTFTACIFFFF